MIYSDFSGEKLSLLGFGTMRLPLKPDEPEQTVDENAVREMAAYAIANGVNYFDTAYPYHGGESERIIGRILKDYPRDSFFLATKYPGHQISRTYNPQEIFEEQLEKCRVDYFDYYLLHNVYENSIRTYTDSRWGIIEYFIRQKQLGRIRHLGFSSHGGVENLREFLDGYAEQMEFCQIQLNYIDWTLQQAKEKYELLTERGIPVWVMEPVRGGRLANLPLDKEERLKALRPGESVASWAFHWLMGLSNVQMVLSGMSDLAQMKDNVRTFSKRDPLSGQEQNAVFEIAEQMKDRVPCTSCRYCCDGCPKGLDIPFLLSCFNEIRFSPNMNVRMRIDALPEEKRPAACIGCGLCEKICPQKIGAPEAIRELSRALQKIPSWEDICKERDLAAMRGREKQYGQS